MKNLILIAASFTTLAHAACVDLSGTYYVCRSNQNVLIEGTDLTVKTIRVPGNTFYNFDFLSDGQAEREQLTFPANGVEVKLDENRRMSARCLGNLVQARTTETRDGEIWSEETSQYFKQGNKLVRISRGYIGTYKYTDILTCE